jgi:hypothetical protein
MSLAKTVPSLFCGCGGKNSRVHTVKGYQPIVQGSNTVFMITDPERGGGGGGGRGKKWRGVQYIPTH